MSRSIISEEEECFLCSALYYTGQELPKGCGGKLEKHHIMFGFSSKDRQYSEKYGLWVRLCPYHHRNAKESVHKDKKVNILMRKIAQKAFMREHPEDGFEKWMQLFRKNYLDDEGGANEENV